MPALTELRRFDGAYRSFKWAAGKKGEVHDWRVKTASNDDARNRARSLVESARSGTF